MCHIYQVWTLTKSLYKKGMRCNKRCRETYILCNRFASFRSERKALQRVRTKAIRRDCMPLQGHLCGLSYYPKINTALRV